MGRWKLEKFSVLKYFSTAICVPQTKISDFMAHFLDYSTINDIFYFCLESLDMWK